MVMVLEAYEPGHMNRVFGSWLCRATYHVILYAWENREPGGLPSIGGANPPDERKEGVANVCYICWFDSDWNIHLRPCKSLL